MLLLVTKQIEAPVRGHGWHLGGATPPSSLKTDPDLHQQPAGGSPAPTAAALRLCADGSELVGGARPGSIAMACYAELLAALQHYCQRLHREKIPGLQLTKKTHTDIRAMAFHNNQFQGGGPRWSLRAIAASRGAR